jgi:PAS domain S-box-containing protein
MLDGKRARPRRRPTSRTVVIAVSKQPKKMPVLPAVTGSPGRDSGAFTADLQTVLDAFPYYVMLVDSEHTVLLANRAVAESLGTTSHDIVGQYCPRAVHGSDGPYPGCPLEKACARGCSVECEMRNEEKGQILVSGIYETPLRTAEGHRVYLHATRDITEQRRAEDALARGERTQMALNKLLRLALEPITLEEIFAKVLEIVATLPWTTFEPKSVIFLADATAEHLAPVAHRNMSAQAMAACAQLRLGECVCGLAAKERRAIFARSDEPCHSHHAKTMGPHAHYCAPMVHGDKLLGVLALYLPPGADSDAVQIEFADAVANVLASIVVYRRAEEARLAHERIALTRERLARVGELAAGVANLVRNPLQGVLGCMEILEDRLSDPRNPQVAEPLALMREGLLRIGKVTERLLALAQNIPCRPRRTDIFGCLDEVRGIFADAAAHRHVTLALDARPDCHAEVDPDRFVEAVANVVGNAIDASPKGGVVTVRARTGPEAGGGLQVDVEDRGEGIPAGVRAQVFDAFFSTKPVGKGSGLGLSITRRILEEHGGSVALASEVGRGTTVSLRFPQGG